MAKNSSHNAVAVRKALQESAETYMMATPIKSRKFNAAIARENRYLSDKDAGHLSGMPAKCWYYIITIAVDNPPTEDARREKAAEYTDAIMMRMFGDENAGKLRPRKEVARVRRSLDSEEMTPKNKKRVKLQKKGRK
jgi:hypothetical protein